MATPNPAPLAPVPNVPERITNVYEVKIAPNVARRRGPLLHEEGLSTDPSVRPDYLDGVLDGDRTGPGSSNHAAPYYRQSPQRTLQQRSHPARTAWVEEFHYLGGFAAGTSPEGEQRYLHVTRSGRLYWRRNAAEIREESAGA